MKLPTPEAPAADLMSFIDRLEDEATRDPNRAAWETNKQRWLDLYTGNHFAGAVPRDDGREPEEVATRPASTIVRVVYNRVMNAVLSHLAGQVGNSPKTVFNARESGEPPIYYLNGYVQHPLVQQMAMQMGAQDERVQELQAIYGGALPGQMEEVPNEQADQGMQDVSPGNEVLENQQPTNGVAGGTDQNGARAPVIRQAAMHDQVSAAAAEAGMSVPIQEPFVTQIKHIIDQGRVVSMQARMAGQPVPQDIVPPEALVEITDQTTAQFTQTIYDALWEQCGGVEAVNENILNKKIIGWQPTLFESDRAKIDIGESPITLTNIEGAQVYYDPMTSSYRPPRYAIMREPVSVEEGVAKYPEVADVLREKASAGTLGNRLSRNGAGGRLADIDFGRDMCVVRTLWIRDWPYPMDPDEALEKGKVQIVQVPDESAISADPNIQSSPATQLPESVQTDAPQLPAAIGGDQGATDGLGAFTRQPAQIPTRQAFLSSDTGEEVTPGAPGWPLLYAIREIRDIEGELVFDQRCRCPDIPLPCNINIPVPFSPYGIGEPDRLDGLQMAINRVLSDLLTFHRYNAYPPEVIHQSVADRLPQPWRKMRTQPNSLVIIPHDIADQVGGDLSKCVQFLNVAQMSPDAWKLLEFLVEAIDKEANNSEVSQGIAPSGSSGAWVANLQAAAAQVTQVTSLSTEAWLKKLVRLFVYFIAHDMTVQDIQKYTSKYPPPILQAFHSRQKALYLDISVEIQSGSAAAKQGQTTAMIQAKQAGLPVSAPSIMERMNLDPDAELKREGDFRQKMLETGAIEQVQPEQNGDGKKQPAEQP